MTSAATAKKKPQRIAAAGASNNVIAFKGISNMQNSTAARVETKDQPFMPDTPEDCFVPDPRLHGEELSVDAVLCFCARMQALLVLLQADGQDTKRGFTVSHETVTSALWMLEGQVIQLRALAEAACLK